MADTPVLIPIELQVTDIDMDNVDLSEVQKTITERLAGTTKAINDVFSKIDPSKINKAIKDSMAGVSKSTDVAFKAQQKFQQMITRAGESSDIYKEKMQELAEAQKQLEVLTTSKKLWEDDQGKFVGGDFKAYTEACRDYEAQLRKVQELQAETKPENFALTGTPEAIRNVVAAYQQLCNAILGVNNAQKNFNQTVEDNAYTDAYMQKLKELEEVEKKVAALREKSARMQETGAGEGAWKGLQYDAEQLRQKVASITEELKNMVNAGQAFRFGGDAAAEIEAIESSAENLTASLNEIRGSGGSTGTMLAKAFNKVAATCAKATSAVGKLISKMLQLGHSGKKSSQSIDKSMKKIWKNFLMFGLGFRSMYYFIKRLRTTFINEMKKMAETIPEVNTQISSFMTAVASLKGALGTAFQPILSVVIPALNALIAALIAACNALGRFFATLTGQGYMYKFTAQQKDYAKSLAGTGGAADKAVKSLMGFDEINRLDKEDEGGGGGGAVDDGTWEKSSIEDAYSKLADLIKEGWKKIDFTEVGAYIGEQLKLALTKAEAWIEGPARTFGQKIATLLGTFINGFVGTDGLAKQIGSTVGAAINTAMHTLDTFLTTTNWLDVGVFIADAINSFIEKTDFSLIGKTIGDRIMASINVWWATVVNTDFKAIGQKIADAINSLFDTMGQVDDTGLTGWQKLGQSVSKSIEGILQVIITALQNINWDEVGQAIGEFISSIDWGAIVWDLAKMVASLVAGIAKAIADWHDVAPISASIAELLGIALIGAQIIPAVTKVMPFITKLGEAFSLAAGGAGTLHEALSATFGAAATTVAGVISIVAGAVTAVTNFMSMLRSGFSWVKEALMVLGIALVAVGAIILGAPAAIAAVVAAIVAVVATLVVIVKEHWTEICDWVSNAWQAAMAWIVQAWKDASAWVVNGLKAIGEWFVTTFNNILAFVKTTWNNIIEAIGNALNAIKEGIVNALTAIDTWWQNTLDNIHNTVVNIFNAIGTFISTAINNIATGLSNIMTNITTAWNNAWASMGTAVSNAWNSIVDWVKGGINQVIGFINNMLSAIVGGINKVAGLANTLSFDIPDWVPGIGGQKFGLNIPTLGTPQIPYLAQGAVIPPNKQFLAMLGDQSAGTNVEAPLSTIQEAVAQVMDEQLDALAAMAEAIVAAINNKDMNVVIGDREIGQAANRYNRNQGLARGVTG